MCLELLGLVIVVLGLRATHSLFDEPTLMQVARDWLKRFPKFKSAIRIVVREGKIGVHGASAMTFGTVSPPATASTEERVAALEENVNQIHNLISEIHQKIDTEGRKHAGALESERRERESADEKTQELLRDATAGGLYLEAMGVIWLFLGIVLATASNEIVWFFS